jgi:putative transposase
LEKYLQRQLAGGLPYITLGSSGAGCGQPRLATLHRAVDKAGHTVDFLLTAKRDRKAAVRFLRRAIDQCGTPEKITIDKSGANTAAIEEYNTDNEASIELRQVKYLNNVVA